MHTIIDVDNFSGAEKELLRAAASNQGVLEVAIRADTRGRAINAGRKKFFDPTDRSVAEHYLSLLSRLIDMELMREMANKNTYELTNFGWQLSRKLGR